MVTVTERRRWMLLVITLILALGGGLGVALLRIAEVQRDQDRDMCNMLGAMLPSAAPAPSSSYGAEQRKAVTAYRAHRCR